MWSMLNMLYFNIRILGIGIGKNLQAVVSKEAAGLAAVVVIIFGIKFALSKETGKMLGALAVLMICLAFIIEPAIIISALVGIMKKVLGGS